MGKSCAYQVVSQSEFSVRLGQILLRYRMRKLLLLILSSAMLIGGLYVAIVELLFAPAIFFRSTIGGIILALLGAYLIWTDFIAPRFGIKTWEDNTSS
jgi:hypothetical protein